MRVMIAAAGALLFAGTASAEGVQNGSFETGTYTTSPDSYSIHFAGSSDIGSWTVTSDHDGGNVAAMRNGAFDVTASDGTYSLDLTGGGLGADDSNGNGVLQSFATIVGDTYSLSFDVGTNSGYTSTGGATIEALIDGSSIYSFTNSYVADTPATQNWATASTTFVATGTTTTLNLIGRAGGLYTGLDKVSVADIASGTSGAVPEPASWAMMIAGFGLTGGTLRRHRTSLSAALA